MVVKYICELCNARFQNLLSYGLHMKICGKKK